MAEVQAVKSLDTVNLIGHLLEIRFSKQMADIWNIGLNLALRISDLLSIKFTDIQDGRLLIKESKTGKVANIKLNKKALATIERIKQENPMHIYLFQSHRNQQSLNKPPRPLSRRYIAKAFAEVVDRVGNSDADDKLTKIHGVGKKYASMLNDLGISSYAQITKLKKADVRTLAAALGVLDDRLETEDWVGSAKILVKEAKK